MKAQKAIYCVLHKQDTSSILHHRKFLGFPLSRDSCSWEAEMVVALLKALLMKGNMWLLEQKSVSVSIDKVWTLCHNYTSHSSGCEGA